MELPMLALFFLAGLGLALFVLYDVAGVRRGGARGLGWLFFLGFGCHLAATAEILWACFAARPGSLARLLCSLLPAAIFLALLLYALFFAIPFSGTYVEPAAGRRVCRTGMYGLCRHPGIVWYCLFYLALFLAAPCPAAGWGGLALCAGNLGYGVLQDLWTFPKTFSDYASYRRDVPFLIPTRHSIQTVWRARQNRRCRD